MVGTPYRGVLDGLFNVGVVHQVPRRQETLNGHISHGHEQLALCVQHGVVRGAPGRSLHRLCRRRRRVLHGSNSNAKRIHADSRQASKHSCPRQAWGLKPRQHHAQCDGLN